MTGVTETPFRADAIGPLLELWRQVMPGDAPGRDRFRDIALLNPVFRPEGLRLLWRAGRLAGFCYVIAEPPAAGAPGRGWLAGLGVAPAERGAGAGTRLLGSGLRFLAEAGCGPVELGGNGERYLLPGADLAAYPEFGRLIGRAGFRRTGHTEAMSCGLDGVPRDTERAGGAALAGGADPAEPECRAPADGELAELLAMIAGFSPSWRDLVSRHLERALGPAGGSANLWLARGPDGLAGFAGWDLFPGCPGRFGPMGVVPAARGQGVGARLLRLALGSMAAAGHHSAWFLWGPEGAAGRRMYTSAGFRVSRQFEFFRRDQES